jgi:hypothetical protein
VRIACHIRSVLVIGVGAEIVDDVARPVGDDIRAGFHPLPGLAHEGHRGGGVDAIAVTELANAYRYGVGGALHSDKRVRPSNLGDDILVLAVDEGQERAVDVEAEGTRLGEGIEGGIGAEKRRLLGGSRQARRERGSGEVGCDLALSRTL